MIQAEVSTALSPHSAAGTAGFEWTVVAASQPADLSLFVSRDAQDGGLAVGDEPLAAAAPFTYPVDGLLWDPAAPVTLPNCPESTPVTEPCWMAWRALRPPLKALQLNDKLPWQPDYPVVATWRLKGDPVAATALAELLAPALTVTEPLHLVAVGDLMLARSLGAAIAAGDFESPFAAFAETVRDADVAVGNLESALGTGGEPAEKRYPFLAPPQAADALALAGFDLVSLANNHAQDFGPETLLQAIDLIGAAGVSTAGAGRDELAAYSPTVLQIGDLRVAFLAYVNVPVEFSGFDTRDWMAGPGRPGVAWGEPDRVRADVHAAGQLADLVIVLMHSGYEYIEEPSEEQAALALAAAEAGADLVLGHHAHLLQGAAFGSETVVLYGLGNFAFDIDGPTETALAHVWLDHAGVRHVALEPAVVGPNGAPRTATPAEAAAILQRFRWLTSLLPRLP